MDIRFDRTFDLLCQESHLAKNGILSGFDSALKANLNADRYGHFYTAFFQLSIGIERLLKLAVVVDHMLSEGLRRPTKADLKRHSHRISDLYLTCAQISAKRVPASSRPLGLPPSGTAQHGLLTFFTDYAMSSRYFNLNTLDGKTAERSPIGERWDLCQRVFRAEVPPLAQERWAMKIMRELDRAATNHFTHNLDFDGHAMTSFDIRWRQFVIEKTTPILIFKLIELLRPIHFLLGQLSEAAAGLENELGMEKMVVPHFEDFFYFLLSDKRAAVRRKRWLATFSA